MNILQHYNHLTVYMVVHREGEKKKKTKKTTVTITCYCHNKYYVVLNEWQMRPPSLGHHILFIPHMI